MIDRIIRLAWGVSNPAVAGRMKFAQGAKGRDTRDMYIGLALLALSYLRRTRQRRQLLYRREVSEGSALVIHHKDETAPRLEILKPKKRR